MTRTIGLSALALVASVAAAGAQDGTMSFFVTSQNPGKGANLGGLDGADAWCASPRRSRRAPAARPGAPTSPPRPRTPATASAPGPGSTPRASRSPPSVDALHADNAAGLTKETALNETGEVINGRGDSPNRHDILTGSLPDGTASARHLRRLDHGRRRGRGHGRPPRPHGPRRLARRRSRGTPRTPRAAAAASRRCAAPAATACSTASPPTDAGSSEVTCAARDLPARRQARAGAATR